jgi:hypothetical protein
MLAKPYHRPLDGDRSGFLENESVSVIGDRANAGAGAHRRRRYDPVIRELLPKRQSEGGIGGSQRLRYA